MMNLTEELKKIIKGDVLNDQSSIEEYSRDASIFEIKPEVVVFPKTSDDVKSIIKFVNGNKSVNPNLAITARSAGTDMSGGALGQSIVLVFTKYINRLFSIENNSAIVEPGMFYRDFEKQTLAQGLLLPSFPASKEICAIGGMINNNAGGEKSLIYGKTENYIEKLKVVLSDGNEYDIQSLTESELQNKITQADFEGNIYRNVYELITSNYEIIKKAKPKVSKNSAGYYLWNVWDPDKKTFDLTKLLVGSQGTLGIVTQAKLKLVPIKPHSEMAVIFLHDVSHLGKIIREVLLLQPESFESYDDNTLKLALKYFYSFAKLMGTKSIISTAFSFIPEFFMILRGGLPKLILQVEFTGDNHEELHAKALKLKQSLAPLHPLIRIATDEGSEKKYVAIRHESFNLLRHKIKDKQTAPFIDDFIVDPQNLEKFLPELNAILAKYPDLIYTIAGHMGDGNFHIIPLMNLKDAQQRDIIPGLSKEVYDLVLKYHGSITAEHNDGLIRTPYLKQMYGEDVYRLFEKVKYIFDPLNIFNPGKKVEAQASTSLRNGMDFAMEHIRKN